MLLGDIRKQDKTRPKVGLVDRKLQKQGNFHQSLACLTEGWLLQTPLHNWTNAVSASTVRRRLNEAGLYGKIVVNKVRIKDKVEQSRERSRALPYTTVL